MAGAAEGGGGGNPTTFKELREVDCTHWATSMVPLKDVRDQKEVRLFAKLLLELGHKNFDSAADLMAMRIREILMAKRDGGSWEKASILDMGPGAHAMQAQVPDGAFLI